jgi:hypothetical protein
MTHLGPQLCNDYSIGSIETRCITAQYEISNNIAWEHSTLMRQFGETFCCIRTE